MSDSYPFGSLAPMPRNPAAPADWAQNIVRSVAGSLANLIAMPKRAMERGITTEQAVPWGADVAMAMVGTPAVPAGALGSSLKGIRAYHVSPYDFDRFDISKVRTGQGANSYGEGIYVAENPKVSGGQNSQYWREFADRFTNQPTSEGMATRALLDAQGDRAAAIAKLSDPKYQAHLKDFLPNSNFKNVDPRDALRLLESDKPVGPRSYEVNINAKPEQFLDWDRPLTEQPKPLQEMWTAKPDARGSEIYHGLAADLLDKRVHTPLSQRGPQDFNLRTEQDVSAALREAGIPGIKYLDQGSRGLNQPGIDLIKRDLAAAEAAGDTDKAAILKRDLERLTPTSNYVLFDDKIIDILRKYALAGAAPVAGAAGIGAASNSQAPFGSLAP